MIVLGIVGPIGAGKTYVLDAFCRLGAETIKADDLSRQLQKPGTIVVRQLLQEFGGEYFDGEGALLRSNLAGLIFSDESARERLNNIMYPAMRQLLQARLTELRSSVAPPALVVVEAANLIEMGAAPLIDYLLNVTAPRKLRRQRLCKRDGITAAEAEKRINSQAAAGFENTQADFEISTDVEEGALLQSVENVYHCLLSFGV